MSFGLSTVESFPEMFGIEPSEQTQAFRISNPVSGFVSQAIGGLIPYVGEAKLLRMVPQIGAGIDAAKAFGLARGPGLGAALEAGAEMGAVGAVNTAIAATPLPAALYKGVTGQDPTVAPIGDIALGNAAATVGGAVLGGGLGLLGKRFAFGQQLSDLVPDFDKTDGTVNQIRALNDVLGRHNNPADELSLPPEVAGRLNRAANILTNLNLQDIQPTYTNTGDPFKPAEPLRWNDLGNVYRSLVDERKTREISNFMNSAARVSDNPNNLTQTQRLIVDTQGGFHSEGELQNAIDAIGVPGQILGQEAQDLKVITVREGTGYQPMPAKAAAGLADFNLSDLATPTVSPEGAAQFDLTPNQSTDPIQEAGRRLLSSDPVYNKATSSSGPQGRANGLQRRFIAAPFKDVGNGFRMAVDSDGMYVFNKKIVGDVKKAAPGDSWAFFRTDRPDLFAPQAAKADDILMKSAYFPTPEERLVTGEQLFDSGNAFRDKFGGDAIVARASKQRGKVGAYVKASLDTAATKLAPSGPLFEKNPISNYAWQMVKHLEHYAELRVNSVMNGRIKLDLTKGILRNTVFAPQHEEGLRAAIRTLTPADLHDVKAIVEASVPFERVQELHEGGNITDGAHNFLAYMQLLSDEFVSRHEKLSLKGMSSDAMNLLGSFQARQGHYMLTRQYPGAYKVLLHDANGELVGFATEHSPLEAQQAADKIIEEQAKQGKVVTAGGMVDGSVVDPALYDDMKKAVMKPGFLKNRGDMIGYEFARGDLTVKKLGDLVERNLRNRESFLRDVAIIEHTAEPLSALRRTEPQLAEAFTNAVQRMRGDEGAFARFQNKAVDTILHAGGLSGKDSATAIVRGSQKLMSAFQFGFNLSQPIQNIVGMMQTILPEISYLLHADELTLARNYVSHPLLDSNNNVKGVLGQLSELKVMKNSFDRFMTPLSQQPEDFRQLLADMVNARIINGRITEEQYGSDGYILTHPRDAFRQGHSVVDVMKAASTILMTKSEEINRTMALHAAYEIGTARGFDGQRMRLFAQELIHKTQYSYATHDRAAVWTTPLGSLGGTFKNWMFHYLGSMIKYSTAGPAGMRALAWQTAITGLVGGAAATPIIVPLANAASQFLSNKSAMQNLYDAAANVGLPENVADGVMYGLPGSLGLSLSSQVASPASDPMRDASMLWSFAAFDRMKALSAGTKDALVAYKTLGQNPFQNPTVRDELVRALAPRMIYRAMALGEQGAIRSMSTGYDVARLGLGGAAMYVAGFNPTELDKTYQVYSDIRNDQAAKKQMTQEMGSGLADAWQSGDDRMASRIYVRAMAIGVDMSSVLRSAQSRQLREQQTQLEYTASPQDKLNYSFEFNDPDQQ